MQRPVMYIIANKGLGMSPGKLAAQVAHGAVRSVLCSGPVPRDDYQPVITEWFKEGETKIVLEAHDAEHLLTSERYLNEHGIKTFLVIDEGRTEIPPQSPTVLATEIVDKADPCVQLAMKTFRTYREEPS